jgi:hypothetical protein
MIYQPPQTLAFWLSAPQFSNHAFGEIPAKQVGASTTKYWAEHEQDLSNPDFAALNFYALNQMVMTIRQKFTMHETLPEWANDIMADYMKCVSQDGERLLHYLFLICTREARHAVSKKKADGFWAEFGAHAGTLEQFYGHLKEDSPSGAAKDWAKNELDAPVGTYMAVAVKLFNKITWGGGYGGKPWGLIASTALSFLEGKTTMEMMIDTAWTLAHNNGPMFNKGMLYSMYSDALKILLDVQRSGQVCELLMDEKHVVMKLPEGLKKKVRAFAEHCPDAFGDFVDWEKVEKLGALGKYGSYKQKQAKLYPKPAEPVFDMVGGKKVKLTGSFWVTPNESVPVYERIKETA